MAATSSSNPRHSHRTWLKPRKKWTVTRNMATLKM